MGFTDSKIAKLCMAHVGPMAITFHAWHIYLTRMDTFYMVNAGIIYVEILDGQKDGTFPATETEKLGSLITRLKLVGMK